MGRDFSLIERKVIMVNKLIRTKFKEIKISVATNYEVIYGKYVPTKFEERIKYIPTEFEIIKVPLIVQV